MAIVNVRIVVSVRGRDHFDESLLNPSFEEFAALLSDLYERLGCQACDRETMTVLATDEDETKFYSEEPEASAEQVASELWGMLSPKISSESRPTA